MALVPKKKKGYTDGGGKPAPPPLDEATLVDFALKYYAQGKFYPCALLIETARKKNPDKYALSVWVTLARAHVKVWRGRGSPRHLQRALEAFEFALKHREVHNAEKMMVQQEMAEIYMWLGRCTDAEKVLNGLVKEYAGDPAETRWQFLMCMVAYVRSKTSDNKFEKASKIKEAAQIMKELTQSNIAPYTREESMMVLGLLVSAEDGAIELDDQSTQAKTAFEQTGIEQWLALGDKCSCMLDYIFACAAFEQVDKLVKAKKHKKPPAFLSSFWVQMANAQSGCGETLAAKLALKEALKIDGSNVIGKAIQACWTQSTGHEFDADIERPMASIIAEWRKVSEIDLAPKAAAVEVQMDNGKSVAGAEGGVRSNPLHHPRCSYF